jgi:DNA topoisomerase-1
MKSPVPAKLLDQTRGEKGRTLSKALVVVESPAKARTISRFLGKDYKVVASYGHVRDLPQKKLGVDPEKGFQPEYVTQPERKKTVTELKKLAEKADKIVLAPDPDREGEAICWHLAEILAKKNGDIQRVMFNEITRDAILRAIEHPGQIDLNKVNAQQARRILDRLVGYKISPLLWRRVGGARSAGRVQSVAVRLICEREDEIRKFEAIEYWTIDGTFHGEKEVDFSAALFEVDGKKILHGEPKGTNGNQDEDGEKIEGTLRIESEEQARDLEKQIREEAYAIRSIQRKQRKRNPPPPYITSTLQQDAARRLGFTSDRTMRVAQSLYEGVDLGDDRVGLITYMRTDSVRIAPEAATAVREFISGKFGKDYLPGKARAYAVKKGAQDAHECIRPTGVTRHPEDLKKDLNGDQYRLYSLIWSRFVACQMKAAVYDQTTIEVAGGPFVFRTTGSVLKFDGFTRVYHQAPEKGQVLPEVNEGEKTELKQLDSKQHFTNPPPRYNDASLIRELEERGIGRPSTYASIVKTIVDRKYVERREKRFHPTDLGELVNHLLIRTFPGVMDIGFTAEMEEKLDEIEEGRQEWQKTLEEFYGPFSEALERARTALSEAIQELQVKIDETCPDCEKEGRGKPQLIKKWGRNGWFIACPNYPDCKYTRNIHEDEDEDDGEHPVGEETGESCEKCGKPMVVRKGRMGKFLGCSGYPDCKNTRPINPTTRCPKEGCDGWVTERRSRRGRVFYGCSRYPDCDFVAWKKPVNEPCPECGSPFLVENSTKRWGDLIQCPNKECKYRRNADEKAGQEAESTS